ncbi:MAG: hypothetical protein ABIA97_02115 [Candidatus Omnitrophota bacterium]
MKKISFTVICLLLGASLCFSQTKYSVSRQTLSDVIELKANMNSYSQEILKQTRYLGLGQDEQIRIILNYIFIINGKLDALISILDFKDSEKQDEQPSDLSPEEVKKFINYVLFRLDTMRQDLDKRSQSTNDALMIHHVERIRRIFAETEGLLRQVHNELGKS